MEQIQLFWKNNPMEMPKHLSKLFLTWFLCFLSIISPSLSARTLASPPSGYHHNHAHHAISFYMPDVLSGKNPLPRPATTKMMNGQLPFSKPVGFFPPRGGVPLTGTNPTASMNGVSSQTLEMEGISMSFPAIATLQELEMGTVTTIDEDIYGGTKFGLQLLGKVQGMYVAGSEDGSSHMMAVTASFAGNQYNDELRFFGVHRLDVVESHIAVIGGTGKYLNANGYATVKTVNESYSTVKRKGSEGASYKVLEFNVYLG